MLINLFVIEETQVACEKINADAGEPKSYKTNSEITR